MNIKIGISGAIAASCLLIAWASSSVASEAATSARPAVASPVTASSAVPNRDDGRVAWHRNVDEAWKATQENGRPMLVFVTRGNCFYCEKMKASTLISEPVTNCLKTTFVPLVLDGSVDSPLLRELRVSGYPSTFIISPQAVILDRIDGYVTPEVLATRLRTLSARPPTARLARDP